jgi:hypothetical protein
VFVWFTRRPSRLDCGLESRVYRQRFSTIDAPCSLYSEREIHSCWNDPSEAMMEPPIHGACRRSSPLGFRNRDLYVALSVFTSSFCRRGANPGNRLLPPDMIIYACALWCNVYMVHGTRVAQGNIHNTVGVDRTCRGVRRGHGCMYLRACVERVETGFVLEYIPSTRYTPMVQRREKTHAGGGGRRGRGGA